MVKRKKEVYKFSGRNHSIRGLISVIIGGITLLALIILSVISSLSGGNGGLILGIIGMVLFIMSIAGFILGIKSCREKEIFYTAPVVGMVLNGFLFIVFFALYMVGIIV